MSYAIRELRTFPQSLEPAKLGDGVQGALVCDRWLCVVPVAVG